MKLFEHNSEKQKFAFTCFSSDWEARKEQQLSVEYGDEGLAN